MTTEITAVLKRHPIWYGPRPDWVFTWNVDSFQYRTHARGGALYEIRFSDQQSGIWIGRRQLTMCHILKTVQFWTDATRLVFAKSLHFSDVSKFVFPIQKGVRKVTKKVSK